MTKLSLWGSLIAFVTWWTTPTRQSSNIQRKVEELSADYRKTRKRHGRSGPIADRLKELRIAQIERETGTRIRRVA